MPSVQACALPPRSLLTRYAADGAFIDCYVIELPKTVAHSEFVEALYLGALMRFERKLIGWLLSKPTSNVHVRELATGNATTFAAWHVEERTASTGCTPSCCSRRHGPAWSVFLVPRHEHSAA